MRLMRSMRTTAHGINSLREVGVSDRIGMDRVWEQLRKYPLTLFSINMKSRAPRTHTPHSLSAELCWGSKESLRAGGD